ncbi:MAG: hypothetical protein K0B81_04305 [Candidatus Cloacimonetes bacterium]|nr:hypothetical protein [Candidatus Cloacimonadota bacterium]
MKDIYSIRHSTGSYKRHPVIMISAIAVMIGFLSLPNDLTAEKYAGEIFRMGAGVRNFALGNTGLTDYQTASIAYWNPALLAKTEGQGSSFELMHAEEFMGLVTYDTFSAVWGERARYALVLSRIGINNIPLTRLPNPDEPVSVDNQPYHYKTVNNSDYILYLGFYRHLGSYVIGFTPKLAYRTLAETSGYGFGADISTYFDLHHNLLLGMKLRDFFSTQIFWSNGTHEIVNPGLDFEFSYYFATPLIGSRSRIIAGTEIIAEGREEAATIHLGLLSFDYHFGLEIPIPDYVNLYAGYDIENFTAGISVNISQFQINYSFKHNTEIDNSHRVSIGLTLR